MLPTGTAMAFRLLAGVVPLAVLAVAALPIFERNCFHRLSLLLPGNGDCDSHPYLHHDFEFPIVHWVVKNVPLWDLPFIRNPRAPLTLGGHSLFDFLTPPALRVDVFVFAFVHKIVLLSFRFSKPFALTSLLLIEPA
jgi:hypothetical protein